MNLSETLTAAANPEKALQMEKYMRNQFTFLGIPAPERKKIFREFIQSITHRLIGISCTIAGTINHVNTNTSRLTI